MRELPGKTGYRTRAQEELLAYLQATPGVYHTAAELKEYFEAHGTPSARRPSTASWSGSWTKGGFKNT